MNTKLTLTIEQSIIESAKKYAREQGRSLSDLVENYFKILSQGEIQKAPEVSSLLKSMRGSFKAPADFDYKEELTKALSKKHL